METQQSIIEKESQTNAVKLDKQKVIEQKKIECFMKKNAELGESSKKVNPFMDKNENTNKADSSRESKESEKNESPKVINPFSQWRTRTKEPESIKNAIPLEEVDLCTQAAISNAGRPIPKVTNKVKVEKNGRGGENVFMSTAASNSSVFNPNVTNISRSGLPYRSSGWLSKDTCPVIEVKQENNAELDIEKENFIKSFADSMVIVATDEILKKREPSFIENTLNSTNKKNFKRFRKVQPLHVQTRIIPKSEMVAVICDGSGVTVDMDSDREDDNHDPMIIPNNRCNTGRRRDRRFNF